jgi:hypothetical protein
VVMNLQRDVSNAYPLNPAIRLVKDGTRISDHDDEKKTASALQVLFDRNRRFVVREHRT